MPSRVRTARPPSRPMIPAVLGDTTPSIADAIIGSSNWYGPSFHEMSMSSGSRVRRDGTIAMSSKPYAWRAFLPRPISISIAESSQSLRTRRPRSGRGQTGAGRSPRGCFREGQPTEFEHSNGEPRARPLDILDLHGGRNHMSYDPHAIEARRQAAWRERDAARTPPVSEDRPHLYIKPSAPFTSGNVHVGHVRSYSIGDAYARFRRARGDDVLFAFGFDAFGLPAELAAIAGGFPPGEWVEESAAHMTGQLQRLGFSLDWERSFLSSDVLMYRWSQWLFLTLYEAGLIYRGTGTVDWCDNCQTTLASIQVEPGGTCWRCHGPVRLIELPQWYLRISAYLEENDSRLAERAASGLWDDVALASQEIVLG